MKVSFDRKRRNTLSYALVSSIIIGYIIITIYEVVYKPSSEQVSERVPSGPSLYSFHWHSRIKNE